MSINTWAQNDTPETTGVVDSISQEAVEQDLDTSTGETPNKVTSPKETLKRLVFNDGQYVLSAGAIFPTVQKLPSTMRDFCDEKLLLDCDVGLRVSLDKKSRPISGASSFGFTSITLDGVDNITTLLYSKGVGVGMDALQILGLSAQVGVGLGVTRLRVNNDRAFTPTADIDVSFSFNLSRLVYRFGGYYRDMLDAEIDGIDYGTPIKGLYFSFGLSL